MKKSSKLENALHAECLADFWTDECAVTYIEYGLIAALIAVAIAVAASTLGDNLAILYNAVLTCVVNSLTSAACSL
jgi:pilus assembly protein Flp/PilA